MEDSVMKFMTIRLPADYLETQSQVEKEEEDGRVQ
jgi:hypothetical protein